MPAYSGWKPSTGGSNRLSAWQDPDPNVHKVVLADPFAARDQGDVPCCVSTTIAVCIEILEHARGTAVELSPLFHYYEARRPSTAPTSIDFWRGLQIASLTGICSAEMHDPGYSIAGARAAPSTPAKRDAADHRLVDVDATLQPRYNRISGPSAGRRWKAALQAGCPVTCGLWAVNAYRRLNARAPVLPRTPHVIGGEGHAVPVIGYDDAVGDSGAFLIKDSRGSAFGDDGFWWLPYELVGTSLIVEAWSIEQVA